MVDYPNSKKARKVFLVLFVGGGGGAQQVPEGLEGEEREDGKVRFERRREREGKREKSGKRKSTKDKDWILKKKEVKLYVQYIFKPLANFLTLQLYRQRGKEGVPRDSKFTGRKRRTVF